MLRYGFRDLAVDSDAWSNILQALTLRQRESRRGYAERVKSTLQLFRQDPYTPFECRLKVNLVSILINLQLEMFAQDIYLALHPDFQDKRVEAAYSCVQEHATELEKIFKDRQTPETREMLKQLHAAIADFFGNIMV